MHFTVGSAYQGNIVAKLIFLSVCILKSLSPTKPVLI